MFSLESLKVTDLVVAFGALVSAVATIVLVVWTKKYVMLTHEILLAQKQSSYEQNRPFVFAGFEVQDGRLLLTLQNSGNRPARNVCVTFDPPLDEISSSADMGLPFSTFDHLLHSRCLMPGEIQRALIGFTKTIVLMKREGQNFKVDIIYTDFNSPNKIHESYFLNTEDHATIGSNPNTDHFAALMEKLDKNFVVLRDALLKKLT